MSGVLLLSGRIMAVAAAFDSDVQLLKSSDHKEHQGARQRLMAGGSDAATALLKRLDYSDRKGAIELRTLISFIAAENKHRPLNISEGVIREFSQRTRLVKDLGYRSGTLFILTQIKGPVAVDELKRFAREDSEERVRWQAVSNLAVMAQGESAFFKQMTKDPSRLVRLAAYGGLSSGGDYTGRNLAIETLSGSATMDENDEAIAILRDAANAADLPLLNKVASTSSIGHIRESAWLASKDIEVAQVATADRLQFLIHSLDDSSGRVRVWAGSRLGDLPDPRTSAMLTVYLKESGHRGYDEARSALQHR